MGQMNLGVVRNYILDIFQVFVVRSGQGVKWAVAGRSDLELI